MTANKSVTAVFVAEQQGFTYILTLFSSPPEGGFINTDPVGPEYAPGETVTISAVPNSGYIFDHWEGDAAGTDAVVTITMDSDKTVTAYFNTGEKPPIQYLPAAYVNQSYNHQLYKGDSGDTFEFVSGPSWMVLEPSTGVLSGMPAAADVGYGFTVVIRVIEASGGTHDDTYTIDVFGEGMPGPGEENMLPYARENEPYFAMVPPPDSETPPASHELVDAPGWLAIDPGTGELSGTPGSADVGRGFVVKVRYVFDDGSTQEAEYMLDVLGEGGGANTPPAIATHSIPDAFVDVPYYAVVVIEDPDTGDAHMFEMTSGPGWLLIDPSTGVLTGTPGGGDVGNNIHVGIRVTDSGGLTAEADYSINVMKSQVQPGENVKPVIATESIPGAVAGREYGAEILVTDLNTADTHTFQIVSGPGWLQIDENTGFLSGLPKSSDAGKDVVVTVRVTDSGGLTDEKSYNIHISEPGSGEPEKNTPPKITTKNLPDATVGEDYTAVIDVFDPDPGATHKFDLLTRPGWLNINGNTGRLSGVPKESDLGTNIAVIVRVTDNTGSYDVRTFLMNVVQPPKNNPPRIVTKTLPDAEVGIQYTAVVEISDPDEGDTHTFELVEGPGWMSVDAGTGTVSGTPVPDDAGEGITVTISVTDSGGLSDTFSTAINVYKVNNPPAFTTTEIPDAKEDEPYEFTLSAEDPDEGDVLTFALLESPGWLGIDENGVLSGTPGDGDTGTEIPVSITVRDAEGLADTLVTVINVLNVNDPPVFLTADILDAVEGAAYSDTLRAEDPDEGDVLTFTLLESPEWLSVDESGILSGTPEDGDVGEDIPVTVTVTDAAGLADTLAVTINVINVNNPPAILTTKLWDATEGFQYADTLVVEDPDVGDDIFTFEMLEGPAWLSMDETGILSGMPGSEDVGNDIPVTITAADAGGLADTLFTYINVMSNMVLKSIEVSPADTLVEKGETIQYRATAYNILDEAVEAATIHWSVIGEIGEIDDAGIFTALEGGEGFVVASVMSGDEVISNAVKVTVFMEEVKIPEIKPNEPVALENLTYPLDFMNGATITFPEKSIPEEVEISVSLPSFARVDNENRVVSYEGDIVAAVAFEVVVDGQVVSPYYFEEPVEISIPFDKAELNRLGIDPLDIRIFYVTASGEFDNEGISDIQVDTFHNVVSAKVAHFSNFAVAPKYAGPSYIGDFDYNMTVDFFDFVQLVAYWNAENPKGDMVGKPDGVNQPGPLPWYKEGYPFPPDGVVDFEDLTAFTVMYNWYKSQESGAAAKPVLAAKKASPPREPGLYWDEGAHGIGDRFTVSFTPGVLNGFIAGEIMLAFDGDVLRAKGVSAAFEPASDLIMTPVQFRSSEGTLVTNILVLGGVPDGVSFDGQDLLEIEVEVVGEGPFDITLTAVDMRNSANTTIPVRVRNTSINGKIGGDNESAPLAFGLSQNHPNPFNMSTFIDYSLTEDGRMNITIYNAQGQKVRTLVDGFRSAGRYSAVWDGTDDEGRAVTSGVYIVQMRQGGKTDRKKIMLLK